MYIFLITLINGVLMKCMNIENLLVKRYKNEPEFSIKNKNKHQMNLLKYELHRTLS